MLQKITTTRLSIFLHEFYNEDSDIDFIDHNVIEKCIDNCIENRQSFAEIFQEIYSIQIIKLGRKMNKKLCQIISFVYMKVMKFPNNQSSISNSITKNFFMNITNLMYGKIHLHHSHDTREIRGYAHSFCNKKVRENKDFFLLCSLMIFSDLTFFYCQRNQIMHLAALT